MGWSWSAGCCFDVHRVERERICCRLPEENVVMSVGNVWVYATGVAVITVELRQSGDKGQFVL